MMTPDKSNGDVSAYVPDAIVDGTVVLIANFGAFVQLEANIAGLILISEISNQRFVIRRTFWNWDSV
jgi:ribosomal protein S1